MAWEAKTRTLRLRMAPDHAMWKPEDAVRRRVERLRLRGSAFLVEFMFQACEVLKDVKLQISCDALPARLFAGCGALAAFALQDAKRIVKIGDGAFRGCASLLKFPVLENLRTIGSEAFMGCGFAAFVFGQVLVSIGDSAFEASGLTEAALPDSVRVVGKAVFRGAVKLMRATGVPRLVGASFFEDCVALRDVGICPSIPSIPPRFFFGCQSLASVFGAEPTAGIVLPDGVRAIEAEGFARSGVTEITLPKALITIGKGAFRECVGLQRLVMTAELMAIGAGLCEGCTALEFFDCGPLVLVIPARAMHGCLNLREVRFGESLLTIEAAAFQGCRQLTGFPVPPNLGTLAVDAFEDTPVRMRRRALSERGGPAFEAVP